MLGVWEICGEYKGTEVDGVVRNVDVALLLVGMGVVLPALLLRVCFLDLVDAVPAGGGGLWVV